MNRIKIRIPATTTNLGPGFDCLGMALTLYNIIEAKIIPGKNRIDISGEGIKETGNSDSNLVLQAIQTVYRKIDKPCPHFHLKLNNGIPFARGLGSSAAAYLGGLIVADYLSGRKLSEEEILEMAVKKEKHPDNVVPAFVGGFTISSISRNGTVYFKCQKIKIPPIMVAVPELFMSTPLSRSILPDKIEFRDAVQNIARTAILVSSLMEGRWGLLREAMQDRLHQSYRDTKDKLIAQSIEAAYKAGAYGASLSGSGSTIFTFIPKGNTKVGKAIQKIFHEKNIPVRLMNLKVDREGLKILK